MTATPTVQLTGPALLGVDAVPAARLLTLPAAVKLGRVAPKAEKPVLRLSAYRRPRAAPAPASSGNRRAKAAASLGRMYRNDVQGCCVISSAYHRLGFWSAVDGSPEIQVADSTIDQMYARLKAGPGDSGCIITDVLDYFRSAGMPVGNGRAEIVAIGARHGGRAASRGGRRGSRVGIHFDGRDWATGKGLREAELRSKFTDSLQARIPSVGRNARLAEYFFRR